MRFSAPPFLPLALLPLLVACDQLGIETPAQENARYEAEGKAVGGSCRQSGRALEDCYQLNPRASKAAIFAGWRDMDAYMRENKIEETRPQFPQRPPAKKGSRPLAAEEEAEETKPAEKAVKKDDAKTEEPKAETKPEVKTETKPEAKPEARPAAKPAAKT